MEFQHEGKPIGGRLNYSWFGYWKTET